MSNYTQVNDYSAKDTLPSGDPSKKILGSDIDAELAAISTAIATKTDDSGAVHTTGTESIAGDKTLSGSTTHSGTVTMSGKSLWFAEGADVASAATTNIWATDGNTLHVTGTTGISSFGTAPQAGAWKLLIFDGAVTLTHGANLNLPDAADYTTYAGQIVLVYADTTTQFDVFPIYPRTLGSAADKGAGTFNAASGLYDGGSRCYPTSNKFNVTNSPSAAASTTFSGLSPGVRYRIDFKCTRTSTSGLVLTFNSDTNVRYSMSGVTINTGGSSLAEQSLTAATGIALEDSANANDEVDGWIEFQTGQLSDNDVAVSYNTQRSASGSGAFGTRQSRAKYTGIAALSTVSIAVASGTITGTFTLSSLVTAVS